MASGHGFWINVWYCTLRNLSQSSIFSQPLHSETGCPHELTTPRFGSLDGHVILRLGAVSGLPKGAGSVLRVSLPSALLPSAHMDVLSISCQGGLRQAAYIAAILFIAAVFCLFSEC